MKFLLFIYFSVNSDTCEAAENDKLYAGCFEQFGCFGVKYDKSSTNCIEYHDCTSLVKIVLANVN